ncbi:MAG: glycosyltransferase, partial [Actinomycetales bacterium]
MTDSRDVFIVANNVEDLGGMTRFVLSLADLLSSHGHRVHLVGIVHSHAAHHDVSTFDYPVTVLHDEDPPNYWNPPHLLHRLNVRKQAARARRVLLQRRGAARLSRLIAGAAPGAVVVVCQVWAMEWVRLADTRDAHVIGMSHESFDASWQSGRYHRVRRFFSDVDRLLLLTQRDADRWALAGMSNASSIPNPLGVVADRTSDLSTPTVVSLGRLAPEKGFDMLLDAWARLHQRHPEWSLRIYGEGQLREDLEARIERLGIGDSAQLMGATSEVGKALLESSIYVLSSRSEGMPVVLTEAMEYGVPCIAFDVAPGVQELITDGEDGLILPPGNVEALVAGGERRRRATARRRRGGAPAH